MTDIGLNDIANLFREKDGIKRSSASVQVVFTNSSEETVPRETLQSGSSITISQKYSIENRGIVQTQKGKETKHSSFSQRVRSPGSASVVINEKTRKGAIYRAVRKFNRSRSLSANSDASQALVLKKGNRFVVIFPAGSSLLRWFTQQESLALTALTHSLV